MEVHLCIVCSRSERRMRRAKYMSALAHTASQAKSPYCRLPLSALAPRALGGRCTVGVSDGVYGGRSLLRSL